MEMTRKWSAQHCLMFNTVVLNWCGIGGHNQPKMFIFIPTLEFEFVKYSMSESLQYFTTGYLCFKSKVEIVTPAAFSLSS